MTLIFFISNKKSIRLGLIVSEILLNSIKHASEKETNYEVFISLKKITETALELKIGNNGSGFDFSELVAKNTLGIDLIKGFADSLNIKTIYSAKNNAYYLFDFKA